MDNVETDLMLRCLELQVAKSCKHRLLWCAIEIVAGLFAWCCSAAILGMEPVVNLFPSAMLALSAHILMTETRRSWSDYLRIKKMRAAIHEYRSTGNVQIIINAMRHR